MLPHCRGRVGVESCVFINQQDADAAQDFYARVASASLDLKTFNPETALRYVLIKADFFAQLKICKALPLEFLREGLIYYIDRYREHFAVLFMPDWRPNSMGSRQEKEAAIYALGLIVCIRRFCNLYNKSFIDIFCEDNLFNSYASAILRLHYIAEGFLSDEYFNTIFGYEALAELDKILMYRDNSNLVKYADATKSFARFLYSLNSSNEDSVELIMKSFGLNHEIVWLEDAFAACHLGGDTVRRILRSCPKLLSNSDNKNNFHEVAQRSSYHFGAVDKYAFRNHLLLRSFHNTKDESNKFLGRAMVHVFHYRANPDFELYLI